jgi:branched-subunit amino acid ABC-type transport system permease component
MHGVIEFAIFGLGIGGVYGLLGNGLVVIYRGSGVVNFAHGALAMAAAYSFYELDQVQGWSFWPACLVSVAGITAVGAITQGVFMRRLRDASPISRLIATLGVLGILDGLASIYFGATTNTVIPPSLPHGTLTIGGYAVDEQSVCLLGIAVVLCAGLYAGSRWTPQGLAMSAVAESPEAAASLGWSPQTVATATWAGGACLAAVAGILIVPVTGRSSRI